MYEIHKFSLRTVCYPIVFNVSFSMNRPLLRLNVIISILSYSDRKTLRLALAFAHSFGFTNWKLRLIFLFFHILEFYPYSNRIFRLTLTTFKCQLCYPYMTSLTETGLSNRLNWSPNLFRFYYPWLRTALLTVPQLFVSKKLYLLYLTVLP